MKHTSVITGAFLPLLLGLSLMTTACKGDAPNGGEEMPTGTSTGTNDAADGMANGAKEIADDVADGTKEIAGDLKEGAEKVGEAGLSALDDAKEGATEASEEIAEAVNAELTDDTAHPDGLNRFAPKGKISDADLGQYFTTFAVEIDGVDVGTMTFEMWEEGAPISVRNHLRLVDEGFYDGLTFHRIIRDFMIQGGCPNGNGMGNSPHGNIKAEFSREPARSHEYGVLSMARSQSPDSASSQFFVVSDNTGGRQLNGNYSTFGKMTTGVATLEAIASVPVGNPRAGTPTKKKVVITDANVIEGEAPTGEEIKRP